MSKASGLNFHVYRYILECIDGEPYDVDLKTNRQRLQFLYKTFQTEKGFDIRMIGENAAFVDYMQGLPSCFNIAFENYRILELAGEWKQIPDGLTKRQLEKKEEAILDNYWNLIMVKTFQLFRQYKVI